MPPKPKPKAKPRPAAPSRPLRAPRLDSLKNPLPSRFSPTATRTASIPPTPPPTQPGNQASSSSAAAGAASSPTQSAARPHPPPPPPPPAHQSHSCPNPECTSSNIVEDEGKLLCTTCGYLVSEDQIAQELTFGEGSNGAAVVQGVYVGANDDGTMSRGMVGGGGVGGMGMASKIAGGLDSRQITERNGIQHVNSLVGALRLSATHKERAMQIYRLAMNVNFIQGRVTRHVAAVCLYVSTRRDRESKVMLIDFSDLLEMNVFKLGQIYNALVAELGLRADPKGLYDMNPENLIQRFASDLEFGRDEHRIANEATRILKRLSRDWITVGRHPAGVCAAAVILAARMNNYRRTVREVVYTAKVTDITIHKRLDEFKLTESSGLTVEEFRHHGLELEKRHDPPAFYRQFAEKERKRERARRKAQKLASMGTAMEEADNGAAEGANNADRRSMPPPPRPVPIDPALLEVSAQHLSALAEQEMDDDADEDEEDEDGVESPPNEEATLRQALTGTLPVTGKRKRGRPKGARNKPLPQLSAQAEQHQLEMETEVDALLNDPASLQIADEAHRALKSTQGGDGGEGSSSAAPIPAQGSRERRESDPRPEIDLDAPIISEHEFASDPEVEGCLLTPAEAAIKERIWVNENADYLKKQQARRIRAEIAAGLLPRPPPSSSQNGQDGSADRNDDDAAQQEAAHLLLAPKRKTRKRRRARMGDLSAYEQTRVGEDGAVVVERPANAAEATKRMMQLRGFSTKINYQKADFLYGYDGGGKSSARASGSASAASSSRASREATEGADGVVDGEEVDREGGGGRRAGKGKGKGKAKEVRFEDQAQVRAAVGGGQLATPDPSQGRRPAAGEVIVIEDNGPLEESEDDEVVEEEMEDEASDDEAGYGDFDED